jgi:hypothetical protein
MRRMLSNAQSQPRGMPPQAPAGCRPQAHREPPAHGRGALVGPSAQAARSAAGCCSASLSSTGCRSSCAPAPRTPPAGAAASSSSGTQRQSTCSCRRRRRWQALSWLPCAQGSPCPGRRPPAPLARCAGARSPQTRYAPLLGPCCAPRSALAGRRPWRRGRLRPRRRCSASGPACRACFGGRGVCAGSAEGAPTGWWAEQPARLPGRALWLAGWLAGRSGAGPGSGAVLAQRPTGVRWRFRWAPAQRGALAHLVRYWPWIW